MPPSEIGFPETVVATAGNPNPVFMPDRSIVSNQTDCAGASSPFIGIGESA